MTITVFDTRVASTPEHVKPTFTEVSRKLKVIRVRILRVRQNLHDIDRMLDEVHEAIVDLEEVTKQ